MNLESTWGGVVTTHAMRSSSAEQWQDAARTRESGKRGFAPAASEANKRRFGSCCGDLNRSTNRMHRKFDPAANYMDPLHEMERVMDDG
jgi:hypothetical protein